MKQLLLVLIIVFFISSCSTIFKPVDEQTRIKYERAWAELYPESF